MRRLARTRRRRIERRSRDPLPLDKALEIIELLAKHPEGLTVPDLAAKLGTPAGSVIRTIAVLQRRQWLSTVSGYGAFWLDPRLIDVDEPQH
jgi:DNA-binding IclR family transcriptional regulator